MSDPVVLNQLAFALLPEWQLVRKLAAHPKVKEDNPSSAAKLRRYMESVYRPERGNIAAFWAKVYSEFVRQKEMRYARARAQSNYGFRLSEGNASATAEASGKHRDRNRGHYRNGIASLYFEKFDTDFSTTEAGTLQQIGPFIGATIRHSVNGESVNFLVLIRGQKAAKFRLEAENVPTTREELLLALVPPEHKRRIFDSGVKLVADRMSFTVDGQEVPWHLVRGKQYGLKVKDPLKPESAILKIWSDKRLRRLRSKPEDSH